MLLADPVFGYPAALDDLAKDLDSHFSEGFYGRWDEKEMKGKMKRTHFSSLVLVRHYFTCLFD